MMRKRLQMRERPPDEVRTPDERKSLLRRKRLQMRERPPDEVWAPDENKAF